MPVPTSMKIPVGDVTILDVKLDTSRGLGIPTFSIRGFRDGKPATVASAYLDSGRGEWDVTLPSGFKGSYRYAVRDVESPTTDAVYWKAVRRVAESFIADVVRDALKNAHIVY